MLQLHNISKTYAAHPALSGISLAIQQGELLAVLGPSGCGKSTLLRIIAGLEQADSGSLHLAGRPIDTVPAYRRGFGLMFQDYALFPHLDVFENIAFGLREQRLPRAAINARVGELLELVGLVGYNKRRVHALSGGERQRVALARALAPRPTLLMLDEPLAALDQALRERLQSELRAIVGQLGLTTIYVTHDQEEAFALADRIALLNRGTLVQHGPPAALYNSPASRWVAGFFGLENLVGGTQCGGGLVETAIGPLRRTEGGEQPPPGTPVTLLLYPDAHLATSADTSNVLTATLEALSFRGGHYRAVVRHSSGGQFVFTLAAAPGQLGEAVHIVPQRITLLEQ